MSIQSTIASLLLTICASHSLSAAVPVAFSANLSTAANAHKLYQPGDPDVPHLLYKNDGRPPLPPPHDYTSAAGCASLFYNPDTKELKFAISYTQLSGPPIMMHIHWGFPGVDGPILFTIFGEPFSKMKDLNWRNGDTTSVKMAPPGNYGFVTGTYVLDGFASIKPPLTKEQEEKLLYQGALYINIHTYLNENGELRGQITPLNAPSLAQ